jgi:hypothetical protein
MTNHDCQMTKEALIPKSETADNLGEFGLPVANRSRTARISVETAPFRIRYSAFFRVSSFARLAEVRRRRVIRRLFAFGLLALLAFPGALCGQTNVARSIGNRFLIMVETSASMGSRKEGTLKALSDLLASGMQGQLRDGDTIGLWTFDQDLHAGRFPLQHWSGQDKGAAAGRLLSFVNGQKCEGQANLDKALMPLQRVLKNSASLTVILISDGEDKIHGTPFDDPINAYYTRWHKEQQKARLPFVTVLRAKAGQLTDYSVTAAPWPLEMPEPPPEPKVAEGTPMAGNVAQRASVPAPAVSAPATVGPNLNPNPNHGAYPAISAPASHVSASEPTSAAPAPHVDPPVEAPMPVPSIPSPLIEKAKPEQAGVEPVASAPATTVVAASTPPSDAATEKKLAVPGAQATNLTPAPVPTTNVHLVAASPVVASTEGVVAAPSASFFQRRVVLVSGLLLMGSIVGLGFILKRRARAADHASLITRSLEREKEQ